MYFKDLEEIASVASPSEHVIRSDGVDGLILS